MQVLCLPEPGNLVIKDLPMPELKEGQAIIKMEMCGICGSDVTAYRGVNPTMRYPINGLGHEGVGVIQEIGENDKGLKPGDRWPWNPMCPVISAICARRGASITARTCMCAAYIRTA